MYSFGFFIFRINPQVSCKKFILVCGVEPLFLKNEVDILYFHLFNFKSIY